MTNEPWLTTSTASTHNGLWHHWCAFPLISFSVVEKIHAAPKPSSAPATSGVLDLLDISQSWFGYGAGGRYWGGAVVEEFERDDEIGVVDDIGGAVEVVEWAGGASTMLVGGYTARLGNYTAKARMRTFAPCQLIGAACAACAAFVD